MKITEEIFNKKIKPLFARSLYSSIATVNEQGLAHVSPIGSVVLVSKDKGVYFEKFTKNIPLNVNTSQYATIMSVNTSKWYWLKSLIRGKFSTPPAIRIVIKLGQLRKEKENEGRRFKRKVSIFKRTKGYQMLWKDMSHIREFEVIEYKPVYIGQMTREQFK
ncbi:MAG: hypothetical protein JKX98_06000 [Alcanivoracaceae bacterium]|nr:hypothetical protein [Alcanivoracaceae bacterium]